MIRRILVEGGGFTLLNIGDAAMLKVAVTRLTELWPHATIEVLTTNPDKLRDFCPSAVPIAIDAREAWLSGRSLTNRFRRILPSRVSTLLESLEQKLWLRFPALNDLEINLRARALGKSLPAAPASFRKLLLEADLLVICGGGFINDCFAKGACDLLDELTAVLKAGVPVVAFGQGIGPMTNPVLMAKARAVLPRLDMIGLREGHSSLPILESIGVPRDRISVTGDDAIELAFERRPSSLGDAIGVNLRFADYAGTDQTTADKLREPLRRAAQSLGSCLAPVIISFHQERDSDVEAMNSLLDGQIHNSEALIESPENVIRLIGKCRVVVTGSYHAAVFALGQGVPVVGLSQSDYYEQKFTGLQKLFPGGCSIIDFRQPTTSSEIEDAIHKAWDAAERVRDSLLEAAARQVEFGRALYQAVHARFPLE